MKIAVVSNNWTSRRGFVAEHGLSLLVSYKKKRVLFDTGQGLALPTNLGLFKRSVRDIDAIGLSHGHYDHTGALEWLAPELDKKAPPLFAHPWISVPRFHRSSGTLRRIGCPDGPGSLTDWPQIRLSSAPQEMIPGLSLTGEIQPRHPEEAAESGFLIDHGNGLEPDPFLDDQALFAELPSGLVIITGCAHAGLIATIERVLTLSSAKKVYAVIGGFHLAGASEDRLKWTIDQLHRWNTALFVPMHCTGFEAIFRIQTAYPERTQIIGAGDTLSL